MLIFNSRVNILRSLFLLVGDLCWCLPESDKTLSDCRKWNSLPHRWNCFLKIKNTSGSSVLKINFCRPICTVRRKPFVLFVETTKILPNTLLSPVLSLFPLTMPSPSFASSSGNLTKGLYPLLAELLSPPPQMDKVCPIYPQGIHVICIFAFLLRLPTSVIAAMASEPNSFGHKYFQLDAFS